MTSPHLDASGRLVGVEADLSTLESLEPLVPRAQHRACVPRGGRGEAGNFPSPTVRKASKARQPARVPSPNTIHV